MKAFTPRGITGTRQALTYHQFPDVDGGKRSYRAELRRLPEMDGGIPGGTELRRLPDMEGGIPGGTEIRRTPEVDGG